MWGAEGGRASEGREEGGSEVEGEIGRDAEIKMKIRAGRTEILFH